MNAILLTMPAVVYVAGISGAIHFANYYRDSAVEGGSKARLPGALHHAWIPCTLSAITSAAGLASLYTSELIPIKLFGVYTALGVLTTLVLLFLFLPAWMQLWPMKKNSALDGDAPKAEDVALPPHLARNSRAACSALAVGLRRRCRRCWSFCGIGLTKINTSIKLTKLFSAGAEIIKNYEWLEKNLGPLVPMEVVLRVDNARSSLTMLERDELVGRVQKSLQEIEEVGNTMSAVTFAPPLETKRMGPLVPKSTVRDIWNKRLEAHRDEYVKGGFLADRRRVRTVADQRPRRRAQRRRLRTVPQRPAGQSRAGARRRTNAHPDPTGQGRQRETATPKPSPPPSTPRPTTRRRWESMPSTPDWCRSSIRPSIKCWSASVKISSTTC